MAKSILLVEDEADLAEALAFHLTREGYAVRRAANGEQAIHEIGKQAPDLVVLDRMLPVMSGDDVAMKIKRDPRSNQIPIIMLTAKTEETDELVGFALGADDYVRKPVNANVLLARVGAVLRRKEAGVKVGDVLSAGPLTLDRARHEVLVEGAPVALTATEFRMLATLMAARGRVLDREQLIDAALGDGVAVTQRTIDVHIAALRKKLSAGASWIQTIRGVGYAFRAPPADAPEG